MGSSSRRNLPQSMTYLIVSVSISNDLRMTSVVCDENAFCHLFTDSSPPAAEAHHLTMSGGIQRPLSCESVFIYDMESFYSIWTINCNYFYLVFNFSQRSPGWIRQSDDGEHEYQRNHLPRRPLRSTPSLTSSSQLSRSQLRRKVACHALSFQPHGTSPTEYQYKVDGNYIDCRRGFGIRRMGGPHRR